MLKIITSSLILFFVAISAYSQGHYPVITMTLQTNPVANNVSNGQPDINDSTIFNVTMKIVISCKSDFLHFLSKESDT